MINYVAKKYDTISRVELLSISKKLNHFTNNGPVKAMLENKLAEMLEISSDKRVFCFSNGTAALHALMMLSEKNKPNMKWVCPAFNFPSAVVGGFNPDILDISQMTSTLIFDENQLDEYDGIILTTLFGGYIDLELWERYCLQTEKVLIIDNASSPLTKINERNVCDYGTFSFGSLHHTKYLGVGEGGFAVIHADDYNDVLAVSNFGFNDNRDHDPLSSNFKMSDISAAHILAHLEMYNVNKHLIAQDALIKQIVKIDGVNILCHADGVVYGNLPVIFEKPARADNTYFQSLGVVANKYYKPLCKNAKNSWSLYDSIINFPLYDSLKASDIKTIVNAIATYAEIK